MPRTPPRTSLSTSMTDARSGCLTTNTASPSATHPRAAVRPITSTTMVASSFLCEPSAPREPPRPQEMHHGGDHQRVVVWAHHILDRGDERIQRGGEA